MGGIGCESREWQPKGSHGSDGRRAGAAQRRQPRGAQQVGGEGQCAKSRRALEESLASV
jgi:hypothetical protein